GVAVGDHGTLLRTTDGGLTWTNIDTYITNNLNAVLLETPSIGWAVGDGGSFMETTDGGLTWTLMNAFGNSTANYTGIAFKNGQGIVVDQYGHCQDFQCISLAIDLPPIVQFLGNQNLTNGDANITFTTYNCAPVQINIAAYDPDGFVTNVIVLANALPAA